MNSSEDRRILPTTYIPCLFPSIPVTTSTDACLDIVSIKTSTATLDPLAFAAVLRPLLGTSGEFSFRFGENQYVLVEGIDNTEKDLEEKVSICDAAQVTGFQGVQVWIDSQALDLKVDPNHLKTTISPDVWFIQSNPHLRGPALLRLNVQATLISLVYSSTHLPASLAKSILELYLSKCNDTSANFISDAPSIVNHPVQSVPSDKHLLLHAAFVERASDEPEHVAIDYLSAADKHPQRRTLTYGRLDTYSLIVAKMLRGLLPPTQKTIIPLALSPSPELYIGYLATLRAGYAFCPLPECDTTPAERIRELVIDVGASVVLGMGPRPSWFADLEQVRWIDISLEADSSDIKTASFVGRQDWEEPDVDDLAYVLFTSGSTGKPKGVQISHRAAASSISGHLAVRALPSYTRWFQFAAPTFDPSLMETFMNFSSGTTICAANRSRLLTDPESVLCELDCTHMMATPSFAAMLCPEKLGSTSSKSFLERGVKFELWTMGERLSDRVIESFSRPDEGYILCNAYGPTEAAINTTLRIHPRHESGVRLGAPIPSATMVILHPTEPHIVPQGFSGELGLAGPQLAIGYLNMPEQTASAFVHVDGIGRVYRTGDKARLALDESNEWSCVEYLGRIGFGQVKLSGRRVELGEIDTVMASVFDVQSAHAVVHKRPDGGAPQLFAFLTPDIANLIPKVRSVVEARLPQHMRPSRYFLGAIVPRSVTGKVDRRAIDLLIAGRLAQDTDVSPIDTPTQEVVDEEMLSMLSKLIAQTLNVEEEAVTPTSNLIDLGIDSLHGVRLLSLARKAHVQGLSIVDILQSTTPISLANVFSSRRGQTELESSMYVDTLRQFASESASSVTRELGLSHGDPLPLILPATPMQAGVLALYLRGGKGSKGYINHSVYKLAPGIDLERFKDSWTSIVRHNPILRSRFVLVDNSAISPFALVTTDDLSVSWTEMRDDSLEDLVQAYLEDIPSHFSLKDLKAFALLKDKEGLDVRFVLSLHHSIFDGASLALMLEELLVRYNGTEAKLRREGFEHSVKDAFTTDVEASTSYWQNQLKDFTPDAFPDLTGLRPSAKHTGHHVSSINSSTTFSQLLTISRTLKSTPLAIIQAAWASILLSYSESESPDIVFGSIVGGRSFEALEYTVGPVFTAVPIRVKGATGLNIANILLALASNNVQGLVHRYPPVSVLSGSRGIIYDTTVALQLFGQGTSQTELWIQSDYPAMETEFSVVLEIWPEDDDSLRLRATCSNRVLIPSASEAMLRQFDDVIQTILSTPGDTPFMNVIDGIRHELQSSLNPHPQIFRVPPNTLIHHEFEENARLHPNALALWFKEDLNNPEKDVTYTYSDLDQRANRLAQFLVSSYGNLADQAIPLCMEKCPELYVAILGVLKAGAAWCPVDYEAPELRKRDLFFRAGGPVVLISNRSELSKIRIALPDSLDVLSLDDPRLDDQHNTAPVMQTSSDHLAYLIWTSGTTGSPKGVPIEHKAAVQSLKVLQREIPHGKEVRCLNFSAYTFDVSVLDIFYALGNSCGTLCSSRKEILVARFAEAVNVFKATQAFLTPAFMAQSSLRECETLESLISIGEKLSDTVAGKWCRPETVSLNTYGPAESTVIVTYRRFEPDEATKAQNVGSPIQTVSCFAMKGGRIVPRGAVGELALGGHQNARGYHRQPDMTAKKFIWHPVAGAVYMTGDIVRFLHDGTCEFVGRNDDLVKLGGIRVELSEISTSFKSCHPAVHDVATMQLSRPDRPQRIICTFLAVPDASGEENVCIGPEALDAVCTAKKKAELLLPVFMLPNVIVVVKRLPHTASNKVDRKALGEYYCNLDIIDWERRLSEHLGDEDDEGNWSETEMKIQNVVSELTGSSKEWIKKLTPLPALGVDSIRALQLASRLRAIQINISVKDILQNLTVKQLARKSDKFTADLQPTISPWLQNFSSRWFPVVQHDFEDTVEQVLPCTPLQEGMLGESVKNPGAYWSHQLFPLNEDTDLERLHAAWNEVSHRDEILRVVFTAAGAYATVDATDFDSDPIFLQIVLSNYRVPFIRQLIDKTDVHSLAAEFAQNIAASHAKSQQPRWSLIFFESTEGRSWMMLSMHHALYDAHTMSYLLEDVQRQYYGKAPLPRLQLSSALSSVFFADTPRDSLRVWEDILTPFANRDARGWPTLSDRAESDRFFSATFDIDFSSLMELTTESNTSISQILQAAWSIVSAAYLKTDRVIFGETLSLRLDDYSLQYAIAPLITTKPVVVHINDSVTPRIIIEELTRLTKLSSQSRSIGFHHVRRVLRLPVSQSLFPSIFVVYFEEENPSSLGTEGLWLNPLDISRLGVEHPVAVNVHISGIKVVVDVLGNGEKMSTRQVALLASQFHAILIAMVGNLDKPLLSLVSSIDEHYLSIVKEVPVSCPRHPLHWLEKSALARPDAVAVTSYQSAADEIWTYRALEEASNQVAHWIHHNCPQSSTVAFCMPRLHTSVVYQLGIFKSGNTYLPIGDEIPAFRKRLIFRTGQASVVFTTRALALEFSSISTASVISVDDIQHLSEISECPVSKMSLPIPEIACIHFADGHLSTSRASLVSSDNLASMVESFVAGICTNSSVCAEDIFLNWMPLSVDMHLAELFAPLRLGIQVANVTHQSLHDDVPAVLHKTGATHALIRTSWLEQQGLRPFDLPSMKCVIFPGIPSRAALLKEWSSGEDLTVLRVFGVPELSGLFTLGIYNYDSPLNIGKPLGSYIALAVRGDSHTAALRGEIGELCVAGDILPFGYLKGRRNAIDILGLRSCKLGIYGRMRADNSVEYIGHINVCQEDTGQNVDLTELSHSIQLISPYSIDVANFVFDHPEGIQTYTVSFVSRSSSGDPLNGTEPTVVVTDLAFTRALLDRCKRSLPVHLLPDFIVPLNFLPFSHLLSGTKHEARLKRIFHSSALAIFNPEGRRSRNVCALTAAGAEIRNILSKATRVPLEAIDADTTTLELGIDSLNAISLSYQFKAAGYFVPPHVILSGPSVTKLSEASRTLVEGSETVSSSWEVDDSLRQVVCEQMKVKISAILPCLPLQEGLVAHTFNSPDPVYVNHFILQLEEADVTRFSHAFDDTLKANDILRTCFIAGERSIVQVVISETPPDIWRHLSSLDDPLSTARRDMADVERDVVRHLNRKPPIRIGLYSSNSDSSYVVCLTMHHAIYDGKSLSMLLSEVRERYLGSFRARRAPISRLLNYIARQSRDAAHAFFTDYLYRISKPILLSMDDNPKSYHQTMNLHVPLSHLERISRSVNISFHSLALAAFGVAVGEYRKQTDNVIGVVLSGRSILVDDIDTLLAPCITTVPIRVRTGEYQLFSDVARRIHAEMTSVLEYQHIPLRLIQRWVGSSEPLFDTLFTFNRTANGDSFSNDLWSMVESKAALDYPVAFAIDADPALDSVIFRAGHTPSFGSVATVKSIMARVAELLTNLNASLEVLPSPERPEPKQKTVKYNMNTWSPEELLIRDNVAVACEVEKEMITKDISFLYLGIDSIISIQLAQKLRIAGLAVPTFAIMRHPCVGELAEFLRNNPSGSTAAVAQREFEEIREELQKEYGDSIPRLTREDHITSIFPATPLQTGMLSQTISSSGRLYMVHHSFELDAGVEPERLRYAWETVVASTDILRCSFHVCPSGDYPWLAAVHSEAPLCWQEHEVHDTSFLRLLAIQIENLDVIPDEEGFKKPPLSLHLINAPDARVLVVTMHHCLYDGLSLPYILDDVAAIYLGLEVTKRPQFADAVPFVLHSSKDVNHFWRNRLSGFVPSPLPKLHPQESSSVNLARQSVELPENALDIIKEMGVTVQTIMLLAWGKTLAALTGSLDVVFGHVVAGRAIELEDALLVSGPLFNTIPFRFSISDLSLSNVEGAQAQQAFSMTAEPHSHVPLRVMQSEWRAETMSMEALFDTLFVFQQGKKGSPRTNLWSRFNVSDEASGSQYPLSLEVTHVSNKLELHAGCQANVMNSTELEEVLRLLHGTLSDIILRPTVSILNQPPRLRDLREQRRVRSVSVLENIPQILGRAFTDNERILRDAFHSISKISMERIGLETPLYALGLDSVGAIQVAAKCRNCGLHIAVADIFAGGTIAAICNAYESQHASETSSSNVEVVELVSSEVRNKALTLLKHKAEDVHDVLPVLAGQLYHLGAWLACGGTSYEPVFAYRATVSLNPTRLHKAWKTLRETHSILRTAFAAVSPQDVLQVVMKQAPDDDDDPSWSFVALEGDFDQLVREQARLEYQRPSTLFVPPARARLVRVNDQNALLLVFHHATYDAWSIPLLVRDLCALYDDLESKSTSNFSDLVRHIHQSTDKRTEADFWRNSLKVGSGFETSILPTTSPSSGLKQIFVRAHGVVSSADTLSTRCQSAGVGLQALVLTVWGRICQDLTGSSAPIVGVYHTGRAVSFDSLTELAGPTVNVLPMRIPAASPIWEVARQIQAELGKRTAYEHTLLQDILGYVGLEEGPLFNIFVNLLWHGDKIRTIRQDMLLSSLSIGPPTDYTSHKPFDLRSSVNSMDYSYLPKLGLYIDVVLNSDSQTLSVALRCHEALLDEERLGHLVDLFGKGVVNAFNEVS